MMRQRGYGHWVAVVVIVATFVAEPKASAEFSWEAFQAIGQFGGAVVVEVLEDEPAGVAR
jgi:hypothetical protein